MVLFDDAINDFDHYLWFPSYCARKPEQLVYTDLVAHASSIGVL